MRGLYVENGRLRYREDLPRPRAGPNECRVQVLLAGVCATDLALVRGYMGFEGVPGHEFVGLALDGPLAGRRVVGEINAACGECPACRAEDSWGERHCANRSVLGILDRGGAFAEEGKGDGGEVIGERVEHVVQPVASEGRRAARREGWRRARRLRHGDALAEVQLQPRVQWMEPPRKPTE